MLDTKTVRKNPEAIAAQLLRKGFEFPVTEFKDLESRRREADVRAQSLQAERKSASRQIGTLIAAGKSVDEAKAEVQQQLDRIAAEIDTATAAANAVQSALETLLMSVPNVPHEQVPAGSDENDNIEVKRWGSPRNFDYEVKDHVDLGEGLGFLDTQAAVKITGSRFAVMTGPLAQLQRALVQFMLDRHTLDHGYTETYVPYLVNRESLAGTGQLPKFEEDLFRIVSDQGYYLIPTAEVPVTNLCRDRIFEADELGEEGLRFVAHTPCFRSEAGSYGRDTRGLIRQHQFEKVELVRIVRPQQSDAALESLTAHAESILEALELPYRKVILCGGDLGFSAQLTYDLEVWLPAQNTFREISSCSNFGDFQARRMSARWRNPETGKPELLHTLNGSGLAVGRTLVAILENYQCADGSITIPTALRPYMRGSDVIR
ncbi:seryl-tRNA synthetase [Luminiphilus syltensis NOR5-1B]|uniref:Serine--tRNA ligase n=1 Tax=Luminiphilus syltensis NOR5-1B TaxID=565045 RepID=B8KRK3_9GAMM|nr:serine--tRNA ligase [Luminiphilus syltensis]EED36947.1 seryl-tRNA synthetase [Luminiphilus syltensis NOR5-1B]